ncbi:hypothetical protein PQO03_12640 [Lentisphaera profundi]|uniref:Uncharacterized protein n=1 Tax=Lentisphaera profundi TaxID=1658616 RepID=A0ABY7VZH6_9BACT|nr:hypothetical protein [Lentisphaera profundi]WDE98684.1 hypothetical protein PQO03_12640 [Lentisphaera profundi]
MEIITLSYFLIALENDLSECIQLEQYFAADVEGFSRAAHVWRVLPYSKFEVSKKCIGFTKALIN